ncbi:MAG: hypothetical protein RL095_5 [Verrucomicrobiota bacterium]|jgi:arylsulfatase A-like enzyme
MKFLAACLLLVPAALFAAEPPPAQSDSRPNIIFAEVDDLTAKYLSAFGGKGVSTPNIDKLAARGAVFDNGVVQGCMCAPSRNSLITARYPHQLGLYANSQLDQLPAGIFSFPKALQQAGYTTAWIGKCHVLANEDGFSGTPSQKRDQAMKRNMGFDHVWQSAGRHVAAKKAENAGKKGEWKYGLDAYADHLHDKGLMEQFLKDGVKPSSLGDDYLDSLITRLSCDWIARRKAGDKPFFLWINWSAPHGPYNCAQSWLDAAADKPSLPIIVEPDPKAVPAFLRPHLWSRNPRKTEEMRRQYNGMMSYIDSQLGRVVQAIEAGKLGENTVIVFFSDHGIMNADHGLDHKETLYKEVLNPALIVAGPGVKAGRVSRPVELIDLAPTVLDLAQAPAGQRQLAQGESLRPLLTGRGVYQRDFAVAEVEQASALVTAEYKLIEGLDGSRLLFDLKADPDEIKNLAAAKPEVAAELSKKLAAWKAAAGPFVKVNPVKKGKDDGE